MAQSIFLKNLVRGAWVETSGRDEKPILNPADGETVLARMRSSSPEDAAKAVAAAAAAFPAWRATPVVQRCRILFHCKELLESRRRELADLIVRENGKTLADAEGEIRRGLEVVEFAAGMPSLSKGDFIEDIASRVDGYIYREPLGVAVGACPFNFPAMIPLWMFPVALACGNTFVLKPSDKCPLTAARLAEIFTEGGLPPGVLNLVHGGKASFEDLMADPRVSAVSFVGSTPAAESVWHFATDLGKRVQSLGGAKNFLFVLPDCDEDQTLKAVIGSTYGCAGERCMASSVLVLVGEKSWADGFLAKVLDAAKALRLGDGLDPRADLGPLISAEAKRRVEEYIGTGLKEGAQLVLDGRGRVVGGKPKGFFLGATVFDGVRPEMRLAKEEIFGPLLSVMRAKDLEEGLAFANASDYGNGASIFTASGGAARAFRNGVECGMVGVNAGVPAPMAFFSFGGRKRSFFGDLRVHGPDGVEFYTRKKAVIERWFGSGPTGSVWGN